MLEHDGSLFVADLKTHDGIWGGPVDQDVPVVDVEVGEPFSVRVDLVGKSNAGFGDVAAGLIEAAAGDFDQWITDAFGGSRVQFGDLREVPVAADHDDSGRFAFPEDSKEPFSLFRKIAPHFPSMLIRKYLVT